MMRQSRALSTIVKRVGQRGSSAASSCAPVKIPTRPLAAHIFGNTSTASTVKRSQLWMACGSSRFQWGNPVMQVTCFSSAASPQASSKEGGEPGISAEEAAVVGDDVEPVRKAEAVENAGVGESEIDEDDLLKENERLKDILEDRETLLEEKDKSLAELKDRLLRSYAEVENVMERARREAENSRKFAIQNFAKGILLVADNLGRASTVVPERFHTSDPSSLLEAGKFLGSLLEGVKMTEKELLQVFKKFGVQKFEPNGEPFDPNFHLAICEVPDPEKEPGSVAVVFKAGYMLHDRVIRPAEVAVVKDNTS